MDQIAQKTLVLGFIGMTVGRAVTAFHRLNAQRIADPQAADGDGAKKRTQVFAETDAQVLPPALGVDVGQRMELEVAGHVAPTQSWNGRSVPVRFNVKTTASLESTPWD